MKVAISAERAAWDGRLDPRFGRAATFALVETETRELSEVPNLQAASAPQGAGVQAAEAVCRAGAQAVITGHCGPKAYAALRAGGVCIFTGAQGTVAEAVASFVAGRLAEAAKADVGGHWG